LLAVDFGHLHLDSKRGVVCWLISLLRTWKVQFSSSAVGPCMPAHTHPRAGTPSPRAFWAAVPPPPFTAPPCARACLLGTSLDRYHRHFSHPHCRMGGEGRKPARRRHYLTCAYLCVAGGIAATSRIRYHTTPLPHLPTFSYAPAFHITQR